MISPRPSHRQPPRGQALVETALVLPIVVLLFMGIIQLGLMLSAYVGATNVARESARNGSVCIVHDNATALSCGNYTLNDSQLGLKTILPLRINAGEPAFDKTQVCYTTYLAPKADVSDPDRWNVELTVDLAIRYPLFIPVIGNILDGLDGEGGDGKFLLTAKEAMKVEGNSLATDPGSLPCTHA